MGLLSLLAADERARILEARVRELVAERDEYRDRLFAEIDANRVREAAKNEQLLDQAGVQPIAVDEHARHGKESEDKISTITRADINEKDLEQRALAFEEAAADGGQPYTPAEKVELRSKLRANPELLEN